MKLEKIKIFLFQRKFSLILILVLLIVVGNLFLQNSSLKYSRLYEVEYVPDIDISNSLFYSVKDNFNSGSIKGFVTFDNITEQPKKLRQYYIIEPLNRLDGNLNRLFSLDTVVKLEFLPPTSIGKSVLTEISNSEVELTLVDEAGNKFYINKNTGAVTMRDVSGDNTRLITSPLEYQDFMRDFLKK